MIILHARTFIGGLFAWTHNLQPLCSKARRTDSPSGLLRQRRLIQPAFHREKLQGLNDIIVRVINECLTDFPVGDEVDICSFMHTMTFKVLIRSLFNIPLPEESVKEIIDEIMILIFAGHETMKARITLKPDKVVLNIRVRA
jgi:cytochrome P450